MNKFFRIISTAIIGAGLLLVYAYLCVLNNTNKTDIFLQPSFFVAQNYWYVFVSGIGCLAFSMISCFLSWHSSMDTKIEVLPNAIAAEKEDVVTWLEGSSLDTRKSREAATEAPNTNISHITCKTESRTTQETILKPQIAENATTLNAEITELSDPETILDQASDTEEETILDKKTHLEADGGETIYEK